MKKTLALGLWLLLFSLYGLSQRKAFKKTHQDPLLNYLSADTAIGRLEKDIPSLMKRSDIAGMSAALIRNGQLVWAHGFGVMNADTKKPVTNETVFEANSLSKPLFAYAVLKLIDEDMLSLDEPLMKYLGDDDSISDDPRIYSITARMVLSHTSGLQHSDQQGSDKLETGFVPGERFRYSPAGFDFLSRVVEKITHMRIGDYMQQAVLVPLGMKSSSYTWRDRYDSTRAYRHDWRGKAILTRYKWDHGAVCCSLQTTPEDYARFVIAVMDQGILRKDSWKEMMKPQVNVNGNFPQVFWGAGWGLEITGEGESFWHWGDGGNSKGYVTAFLPKKDAVIFFSNSANGLFFTKEIVDDAIGGNHPGISYSGYQRYDSPSWILLNDILNSGAARALKDYTEQRLQSNGKGLTESQMNNIGYRLLEVERTDDAIAVFRQNTLDFPQSGNVWDSLAEACNDKGDKGSAIRYYEKSLELNPDNKNAIVQLKKIKP